MPTLDAEANEEQFGNDQPKSMSGPIVGIIYPPPEVRSILCKIRKTNTFPIFPLNPLIKYIFTVFHTLSFLSFNY